VGGKLVFKSVVCACSLFQRSNGGGYRVQIYGMADRFGRMDLKSCMETLAVVSGCHIGNRAVVSLCWLCVFQVD